MIKVEIGGIVKEVEQFTFPGGEVQIRLPEFYIEESHVYNITIIAKIKNSDDIMALLLTEEALSVHNNINLIDLVIDYFPYARQDRRCQDREAFSLNVFIKLINSMNFTNVYIKDIHNEESLNKIKNFFHIPQCVLIKELVKNYNTLVCPDSGAVPKLNSFNISHNIIVGAKVRDVANGEILETVIKYNTDTNKDEPILIVDDICDGGRTFIELAKVLKAEGFKTIDLYVTHGIFSKGQEVFEGLIDNIYTTDSFYEPEISLI